MTVFFHFSNFIFHLRTDSCWITSRNIRANTEKKRNPTQSHSKLYCTHTHKYMNTTQFQVVQCSILTDLRILFDSRHCSGQNKTTHTGNEWNIQERKEEKKRKILIVCVVFDFGAVLVLCAARPGLANEKKQPKPRIKIKKS